MSYKKHIESMVNRYYDLTSSNDYLKMLFDNILKTTASEKISKKLFISLKATIILIVNDLSRGGKLNFKEEVKIINDYKENEQDQEDSVEYIFEDVEF